MSNYSLLPGGSEFQMIVGYYRKVIAGQMTENDVVKEIFNFCANKYEVVRVLIVVILIKWDSIAEKLKNLILDNEYYTSSELKEVISNAAKLVDQNIVNLVGRANEVIKYAQKQRQLSSSLVIKNNEVVDCLNKNIVKITIPDGVTRIGEEAFSNCSHLESITIPDSVTSIGGGAFSGCTGLMGVYITDIAAWCNIDFFGAWANPLRYAHTLYLNGQKVTDLVIPDGVTSIVSYAFYGCSNLKSITIADSMTSIGYCAFCDCTGLVSVTIPSSVTNIGRQAFDSCSSLTSVAINEGVTSIGISAFYSCRNLTSITIPSSTTEIGDYAFCDCSNLKSIAFDNGMKRIGGGVFKDCTGLTSVTIPDSVTSIGNKVFEGCNKLKSIYYSNKRPKITQKLSEYADVIDPETGEILSEAN